MERHYTSNTVDWAVTVDNTDATLFLLGSSKTALIPKGLINIGKCLFHKKYDRRSIDETSK